MSPRRAQQEKIIPSSKEVRKILGKRILIEAQEELEQKEKEKK